jgi:hypothetical protein
VIAFALLAVLIALCALAELLIPGAAVYHAGWFNVCVVAAAVLAITSAVRVLRGLRSRGARVAVGVAAFAVTAVAFAIVTCGLLAPDTQRIVGAPGERIKSDELGGTLLFPFVSPDGSEVVQLEQGTSVLPIAGTRFTGGFLLHAIPRTVVGIDAADLRGAHLTVTQPTGSVFLSPVLLMQNAQTIAGVPVVDDSFAVPAKHRVVKAVLFAPGQVPGAAHGYAVLFDVENEDGSEVPHGLSLAPDGVPVVLGGIELRPRVFSYPALDIIAVPDVVVTLVGIPLIVFGLVAAQIFERRLTSGPVSK